jgi:hypothetical protein
MFSGLPNSFEKLRIVHIKREKRRRGDMIASYLKEQN